MGRDWERAKERGEAGEKILDGWFRAQGYRHATADMASQLQGIDRFFTQGEMVTSVEYKTDFLAHKTGYAFIETASDVERMIPGWLYSSLAQILAYWVPGQRTLYVHSMLRLKRAIGKFIPLGYQRRICRIEDRESKGILLPLERFSNLALEIARVPVSEAGVNPNKYQKIILAELKRVEEEHTRLLADRARNIPPHQHPHRADLESPSHSESHEDSESSLEIHTLKKEPDSL